MSKSKIENRSYKNPGWLKNMYWEQKYSTSAIAKICKCSQENICYYMKKFKISLRSRSEASKGINIINLQGQRFGRLTVLRDSGKRNDKNTVIWTCLCSCGNFIDVLSIRLKGGHTRSCGCLNRELVIKRFTKHGESRTRLYHTWMRMKQRCYSPKADSYKYYGAKGIQVCSEWKDSFMNFKDWALNNGYADNLTIDRINSSENYEPSNCQFITKAENIKKGVKDREKKIRKRLFIMMIIVLMRNKRIGWI